MAVIQIRMIEDNEGLDRGDTAFILAIFRDSMYGKEALSALIGKRSDLRSRKYAY